MLNSDSNLFFNLTNESHHMILMLRDAHFRGHFDLMLQSFYNENFIGNNLNIDISEIEYLEKIEKKIQQNLAPLILSANEAERIYKSRLMYENLKKVYFLKNKNNNEKSKILADLLLIEFFPFDKEVNAVIQLKDDIIPDLLNIINNPNFYDPVFPGFGEIPKIAIECLSKINNPKVIPHIFSLLGKENLSDDDLSFFLSQFNENAKKFFFKILISLPITKDHSIAAFCLTRFNDLETIKFCEELLYIPEYHKDPLLLYYLINIVIQNPNSNLIQYIQEKIYKKLPKNLQKEIDLIVRDWH